MQHGRTHSTDIRISGSVITGTPSKAPHTLWYNRHLESNPEQYPLLNIELNAAHDLEPEATKSPAQDLDPHEASYGVTKFEYQDQHCHLL